MTAYTIDELAREAIDIINNDEIVFIGQDNRVMKLDKKLVKNGSIKKLIKSTFNFDHLDDYGIISSTDQENPKLKINLVMNVTLRRIYDPSEFQFKPMRGNFIIGKDPIIRKLENR